MLSAENLSCHRDRRLVLDQVDLDVRPRELVAVVGGAGAGKTTLLESFLGLHRPSAGRVRIDGIDLANLLQRPDDLLAYVPATVSFAGPVRVADHVRHRCQAFGRRMPDAIVRLALLRGGIAHEWHDRPLPACPPAVQRKLALTLATLRSTRGLLLDEPLRDLEPGDCEPLITSLRLIRKGGAAILLATRDLEFARRVATRVVHLEKGASVETCELTASRRDFHANSYLSRLVD